MVSIIKQNDHAIYNVKEFVADITDELNEISTQDLAPGSAVITLDTNDVYVLSGEKEWVKIC